MVTPHAIPPETVPRAHKLSSAVVVGPNFRVGQRVGRGTFGEVRIGNVLLLHTCRPIYFVHSYSIVCNKQQQNSWQLSVAWDTGSSVVQRTRTFDLERPKATPNKKLAKGSSGGTRHGLGAQTLTTNVA